MDPLQPIPPVSPSPATVRAPVPLRRVGSDQRSAEREEPRRRERRPPSESSQTGPSGEEQAGPQGGDEERPPRVIDVIA